MDSFSVISASPEQTGRIGALVAQRLRPGDAVLLSGDLAAGKTSLVKAVAAALGSTDLVTSPTFALAQFYTCERATILHIDTYRLSGVEEYRDLCGHGRAGQSFIGNRADDFMSQRAVRLRRSGGPEDGRNCQEQTTARRGFYFWTSGY